MPHSALKNCQIVALTPLKPGWSLQRLNKWIDNAQGDLKSSVNDQTTHILVEETTWRAKGSKVQDAMRLKSEGQVIHIVGYEWLDDCLRTRRRVTEKKYSWEKRDKANGAMNGPADAPQPKSTASLMSQVFTDSTDQFVSERERDLLAKKIRADEEARKEEEAARRREFLDNLHQMRIKEAASVFRRGAQRARNELLSDNHHIYTDDTNFTYDIQITKVDMKHNRNERHILTLQIFESNAEPFTYAFTCRFSGTKSQAENSVIAAIGSNFRTAFHAFQRVFEEKTGVKWEDRIKFANERVESKIRARERGVTPEYERRALEDFTNAPFEYHPPRYGTQGEFNSQEQATPNEPGMNYGNDEYQRFQQDHNAEAGAEAPDFENDAFDAPFDYGQSEGYSSIDNQPDRRTQMAGQAQRP